MPYHTVRGEPLSDIVRWRIRVAALGALPNERPNNLNITEQNASQLAIVCVLV